MAPEAGGMPPSVGGPFYGMFEVDPILNVYPDAWSWLSTARNVEFVGCWGQTGLGETTATTGS